MSIRFTQYFRPDGRAVPAEVEMPPEIEALAKTLVDADCVMECEVLTTNQVSFTVERDWHGETEVVAHEIVPNGPQVLDAVERLIRNAAAFVAKASRPVERT